MANSKQAIKRAKQNAETYKLRHAQRSMVRTAVKAVRASIEANDAVKAKELLTNAEKVLDSSASKKVIHKSPEWNLVTSTLSNSFSCAGRQRNCHYILKKYWGQNCDF